MFVAHYISRRRSNLPVVAGIFYALALHIYGFVPPCRCLMARLPSRCSATGKAEPFFISAQQTFSVMHKTSKKCLNGKGISLSDDLKVWRKALTLLPQTKPTQFPSATLRRIDFFPKSYPMYGYQSSSISPLPSPIA